MARRGIFGLKNIILICLALFAVSCLYLAVLPIPENSCDCSDKKLIDDQMQQQELPHHLRNVPIEKKPPPQKYDNPEWGPHRLAIIVPFRDRFEELMEFVPHIHQYLNGLKIRHEIIVVNQIDILRFNRASLINIGYMESKHECDYIAMHDVDLLPLNKNLTYSYPENGPFHVAAPDLHPKYHYKTFVGGILLLTNEHYKLVNGMSNKYWGWGREDDEFYVRIKEANLQIHRPKGLTTNSSNTFKHVHERRKRPRDNKRYFDQKVKSRIRDRITGLDTIMYDVIRKTDMIIENSPVTILNVELKCDLDFTPWCIPPESYDMIQAYLLAEKRGEIGKPPSDSNKLNKNGQNMASLSKYSFREPLDLHNFIFKDDFKDKIR